jgi:hypothetical protein
MNIIADRGRLGYDAQATIARHVVGPNGSSTSPGLIKTVQLFVLGIQL